MEKVGSHWTDSKENSILITDIEQYEQIHVCRKLEENNIYFAKRPTYVYDNSG